MPRLRTDLELPLDQADEAFERALRYLEPFGVGNPGPVMVARDVLIAAAPRKIGTDGIKLVLETGRGRLDSVGWGLGSRSGELRPGARVDLAYRLDVNEYQGTRTLQAVLQDFRASGGGSRA